MWQTPDYWEEQYFRNVIPSSFIPVSDPYAYHYFPDHNWVYNKLELCKSQGVKQCGPHGTPPPYLPVFSKPILNLHGLSAGAKIIDKEYYEYEPGHFWMPLLRGNHFSIDTAVIDGSIVWSCPMQAELAPYGFTKWYSSQPTPYVFELMRTWTKQHLPNYTGILNFEIIGTIFIEVHLRMSCQFIDLYGGDKFLKAVVELYEEKTWNYNHITKSLFSYVLRDQRDGVYTIDPKILDTARELVSSIQLCWFDNIPISQSSNRNERDWYRVAIVNDFDEAKCKQVCNILQNYITIK